MFITWYNDTLKCEGKIQENDPYRSTVHSKLSKKTYFYKIYTIFIKTLLNEFLEIFYRFFIYFSINSSISLEPIVLLHRLHIGRKFSIVSVPPLDAGIFKGFIKSLLQSNFYI